MIGEIDPETIMFLINAIYFKAPWSTPFDKEATHDAPFTLADGTTKQVPMMHGSAQVLYLPTDTEVADSLLVQQAKGKREVGGPAHGGR